MRAIFVSILRFVLVRLARLTIWKCRPAIVGVTGSVGKTSTRLAIASVLASERKVRSSQGNLNNDLGLPLTILGDWSERELKMVSKDEPAGSRPLGKIIFWAKVVFLSLFSLLFSSKNSYPEVLVLE